VAIYSKGREKMIKTILALLLVILTAVPAFSDSDVFSRIDADGNKKIDKQEYRDAAMRLFDKLDKNKDGYLDQNEFKALGIRNGERLFKEWDTNKDGRISRDEFVKGSMRQFMILDKNHDGFIDRNEFDRKRIEEGARKNELMTTPFIIFSF
jgi:Ca2+-binding EF-hand superfamily protein